VEYVTNFPLTQNPISEGGIWLAGASAGVDWSNIQTASNLAFGTQPNSTPPPPYKDSLACFNGPHLFGADYDVRGVCHIESGNIGSGFHELEIFTRMQISSGVARGYEFNQAFDAAYGGFVWWQGGLNQFLPGPVSTGLQPLTTGTILRVVASGNILRGYADYGSGFILQCTCDISVAANFPGTTPDGHSYSAWNDGQPGFGHWNDGVTSTTTALAYSQWSATSPNESLFFGAGTTS